MVYMGRNLISKTTEGIWTKREPEVSHALPLRFFWLKSEDNSMADPLSRENGLEAFLIEVQRRAFVVPGRLHPVVRLGPQMEDYRVGKGPNAALS